MTNNPQSKNDTSFILFFIVLQGPKSKCSNSVAEKSSITLLSLLLLIVEPAFTVRQWIVVLFTMTELHLHISQHKPASHLLTTHNIADKQYAEGSFGN